MVFRKRLPYVQFLLIRGFGHLSELSCKGTACCDISVTLVPLHAVTHGLDRITYHSISLDLNSSLAQPWLLSRWHTSRAKQSWNHIATQSHVCSPNQQIGDSKCTHPRGHMGNDPSFLVGTLDPRNQSQENATSRINKSISRCKRSLHRVAELLVVSWVVKQHGSNKNRRFFAGIF